MKLTNHNRFAQGGDVTNLRLLQYFENCQRTMKAYLDQEFRTMLQNMSKMQTRQAEMNKKLATLLQQNNLEGSAPNSNIVQRFLTDLLPCKTICDLIDLGKYFDMDKNVSYNKKLNHCQK